MAKRHPGNVNNKKLSILGNLHNRTKQATSTHTWTWGKNGKGWRNHFALTFYTAGDRIKFTNYVYFNYYTRRVLCVYTTRRYPLYRIHVKNWCFFHSFFVAPNFFSFHTIWFIYSGHVHTFYVFFLPIPLEQQMKFDTLLNTYIYLVTS